MMGSDVKRFMALFQGNQRSFGQFNPKTKKMATEKLAYTTKEVEKHLVGEIGLGLVPILDDGTCYFGVIDIDCHDSDSPEVDLAGIQEKIEALEFPLVVCRSKSGGAHLYLFASEPIPARSMVQLLGEYSTKLGYPGVEIFPKQVSLTFGGGEERPLGNWINLPYFGGDDTERYAWENNGRSTFDFFLLNAENRRINMEFIDNYKETDHPDAPPCIQRFFREGVGNGYRNEALYSIAIYMKRAFPDNHRDKSFDANVQIFSNPLPYAEAKRTIDSATRRQYYYKCKEEPCRSYCDSKSCLKRKFGISKSDAEDLDAGENGPTFTNLRKFTTDPVRWELEIGEKVLNLSTAELMAFPKVREKAAETLMQMIPGMSGKAWDKILGKLMEEAQIIEAPDDASTTGQIRSKLDEFVQKADLEVDPDDNEVRNMLFRGLPVVQIREDAKVIYFRGSDFVEFLKRTRSEELKGANLWMALRGHGVQHTRLRVGGTTIAAWYIPLDENNQPEITTPNFDPGF